MAQIMKHVGRHGDRKVAVVFREVPGETHMCLVVYTQILNRHVHDALMECINSDVGQQSENLADALNRTYTKDGKIVLQQLHMEGQLKKVQTDQITMTPTPSSKHDVKLSDLNVIIDKMNAGEEAMKEMAELDASRGLQDPADVARRMRDSKAAKEAAAAPTTPATTGKSYRPDDMSDPAIAWRMRQQANKMAAEARGLLAESQRITAEADSMDPLPVAAPVPAPKTRAKKAAPVVAAPAPVVAPAPAPAKRGRPAKSLTGTQA
jgi:hypothetical protein